MAHLQGYRIIAAVLGMGASHAAAAYERLLEEHGPTMTILAGFAGAASTSLQVGDALFPRQVANEQGETFTLGEETPPLAEAPGAEVGAALLSVNHVIATPAEKQALGERHHAAAIDMETFALAAVAARHGQLLRVIRAISDGPDDAPPAWSARFIAPDGSVALGRTLAHLLTHPHHLPVMLRMHRQSQRAAISLAACVEGELMRWARGREE